MLDKKQSNSSKRKNYMKKNSDLALAEQIMKLFKRKALFTFKQEIMFSKTIHYYKFRRFCGRSFGLTKKETNQLLDTLRDHGIVTLSSSGFVVMEKGFF